MSGGEGVPEVHLYAIDKGQCDVGHLFSEPCHRTGRMDDVLDDLREEGGGDHAARCHHAVSDASEEQDSHADDIGEPLGNGGIIPIEYIARGRVTVAEQQMQFAFWDV